MCSTPVVVSWAEGSASWLTRSSDFRMRAPSTPTVTCSNPAICGKTISKIATRRARFASRSTPKVTSISRSIGAPRNVRCVDRSAFSARWATTICDPRPDRRYADNMPFGSSNADERLELLKQENLECALLYPTIGLLWEVELEDPELSLAYARAYNRWIADFCRKSSGRLVPIAQLTLLDPEGSAAELERAVKDGCKGAWVNPFNHRRVIHGDAKHDVLFAKCCELDVPLAIHPTFTPHAAAAGIFDWPYQRPRVGRSDLVAQHRAAGADLVLFARHARPVSDIATRRARSGFGLDRCDARSARRVQRIAESRPARDPPPPSTSVGSASSPETLTRPLRRTSSTTSAPTASCGPRTIRIRIIRTPGWTI